jgi:hypothetical protein
MVTAEEHRRIAWDCLKFGSYLEPANTCGTAQSRPILGQDGAEEAERHQDSLSGYRAKAWEWRRT